MCTMCTIFEFAGGFEDPEVHDLQYVHADGKLLGSSRVDPGAVPALYRLHPGFKWLKSRHPGFW